MLNFKTKCKTGYISTSLARWGSSWGSKEAKFREKFDFLDFSRCFSARIEQTSKNHLKMTRFSWILNVFEDFCFLAEKQRLKLRKLNSLMNFPSLDPQLDPQVTRLVEWNESGVKKPCVQIFDWLCASWPNTWPKLGLIWSYNFFKFIWKWISNNFNYIYYWSKQIPVCMDRLWDVL